MKNLIVFLSLIAFIFTACDQAPDGSSEGAIANDSGVVVLVEPTALLELEGYSLPELPYAYEALEPMIDANTVALHWEKHTKGYYNKLIKAVTGSEWQGKSYEELFAVADQLPAAVLNNAGQVYNHVMYFGNIGPEPGEISTELAAAIDASFGSFDTFKEAFDAAAGSLFGSGWVFLAQRDNGELFITQTSNHVNPLMNTAAEQGQPLLTIDVWEHAYYLNYQNRRAEYIEGFWKLINWSVVSERFAG